ncbi:MAG: class I SAM-dependent methyltransferase [Candidatus Micrarchaeales archaeon]
MREYVKINRAVYNKVARAYDKKSVNFEKDYVFMLKPFQKRLRGSFGNGASVMHLGCGSGLDMGIMAKEGFNVSGFDVSEKMASIAKSNVPQANIIVGDFLSKRIGARFDGVVMFAFLHLFKKEDALLVAKKAIALLKPGGYCIICTDMGRKPMEGYEQKKTYKAKAVRYRKVWTEKELNGLAKSLTGTGVVDFYTKDIPYYQTRWMALILRKEK